MPRWPGPRKYAPLAGYLAQTPADRVTLTLAEIEAILGAVLPAVATWPPFWSNYHGNYASLGWLSAGWRVTKTHRTPDVAAVTFARVAASPAAPAG
jgi:hypothetical protein